MSISFVCSVIKSHVCRDQLIPEALVIESVPEVEEELSILDDDDSRPGKLRCVYDSDSDLESEVNDNNSAKLNHGNPNVAVRNLLPSNESVLGNIQSLRCICNVASFDENNDIETVLLQSSKLQTVDYLLGCLCQQNCTHSTTSKIVIVSNFTRMLDYIDALVKKRSYGACLRIDGHVSVDKRQDFVDCFNRKSETRYNIFLLSSKAGGVGLNL